MSRLTVEAFTDLARSLRHARSSLTVSRLTGFDNNDGVQMKARAGRVGRACAAHGEIGRIVVERFADRRRAACIGVLAARKLLRPLGGFPERQDAGAVAVLLIVGDRKRLDPVAALAVGSADIPRSGSGAASIAKADAGRDDDPVRLALRRQLQACGCGFRGWLSGGGAAWESVLCVPDVSRRWVWKRMEAHIAYMEGL